MADDDAPSTTTGRTPGQAGDTASVPLLNDFAGALPELGVRTTSVRFDQPTLIVLNEPLARELGLDPGWLRTASGIRFLLGEDLPRGAAPVAQAYSGHQFGAYSPRLGDGRALLLGELRTVTGELRDLHLKGSGPTPFTRADGYAALGPMLREYLMGEAMHALGIPTTRALAVISTGRRVVRDEAIDPLPGAVLVRTASSHLRVGTIQLARSTGDTELLRRVVEYAIARHDASLSESATNYDDWLVAVCERQARLVAAWMLVGFVHGVLNTDNVTLSGETIDYGPCAFLDAYDPAAVFSSIDHVGRYAYGNQPGITLWNLTRCAESVLPLLSEDEVNTAASAGPPPPSGDGEQPAADQDTAQDDDTMQDAAQARALAALAHFGLAYDQAWLNGMRAKLGLAGARHHDVPDDRILELARELLSVLREHRIDYTGAFRALAAVSRGERQPLAALLAHTNPTVIRRLTTDAADSVGETAPGEGTHALDAWLTTWLALSPNADAMDRVNPIYIPRNQLLDQALEAATAGELEPFHRLLALVSSPFQRVAGAELYEIPAFTGLRRHVTYCGT